MTLQSEILDGLDVPSWDDSIHTVKRVVASALHQIDRTAQISDTQYFNHSFVPDFVITWPRDPGRTRDIFLRLDNRRSALLNDVLFLDSTQPVMLGLTSLGQATSEEIVTDEDGSSDHRAMLTEPDAIEQFAQAPGTADFAQVVPSAVLKGGKGLVTESVAEGITSAAEKFFRGSRVHDPSAIADSVSKLSEHLDSPESSRIINFGRVVWEATGGDPTQYPVATDLGGVDDTGLRFLLEEAPGDDVRFWRSVGRLVSLDRLLSLGVREPRNLPIFVRANADRLNARALLVKAQQQRLEDTGPTWSVEGGGLLLRGNDFAAYMAPRRDDLAVQPDKGTGLDIAAFRTRASDEQVETVTVTARDGKTVTIESEDIFDPTTDEVLASVGGLPGTVVQSVGLMVSGKHLECTFKSRTAGGNTSAQFDVISLLERALPMLWPLSDERDLDELRLIQTTVGTVSLPPSLFDPE